MAGNKTERMVESLAAPIIEEIGFELIEVEYVKEGPNYFLRIYIDKPGGIMIDDCKAVNDAIEPVLDKEDPIAQAYYLEISSPGLDRPLKTDRDFERYTGEIVEINLFEPVNGSKHHEGELIGRMNGEIIIINDTGEQISFPKEKVSVIRRAVRFN